MATEAFSLRPLQQKDAPRMLEWLQNAEVTEYLTLNSEDMTLGDAQRFILAAGNESVNLHRAIVDEGDVYLGTISLKNIDAAKKEGEYAITMHPSAMGRGAAYAASTMIIRLAFEELLLRRVYLNVLRLNVRAVRLYEKLGFSYTHSSTMDFHGEDSELMWFELIKE